MKRPSKADIAAMKRDGCYNEHLIWRAEQAVIKAARKWSRQDWGFSNAPNRADVKLMKAIDHLESLHAK